MTYNFNDAAAPSLSTTILAATGNVDLVNGSPQGDYITSAYTGSTVTVTIVPPSGWTLTSVSWSSGSNTLTVPNPGVEETHSFNYTVTQNGSSKSNGGVFKIKKAGGS
jgi:FtsP/CotA-like multicopper oxidase with cupredoxin domain